MKQPRFRRNIAVRHVLIDFRVQTVFISYFCFDIGLYFPKASIMAFYWWLITPGFKRLRTALYIGTGYLSYAFFATLFYDFFHTRPISNN